MRDVLTLLITDGLGNVISNPRVTWVISPLNPITDSSKKGGAQNGVVQIAVRFKFRHIYETVSTPTHSYIIDFKMARMWMVPVNNRQDNPLPMLFQNTFVLRHARKLPGHAILEHAFTCFYKKAGCRTHLFKVKFKNRHFG